MSVKYFVYIKFSDAGAVLLYSEFEIQYDLLK